MAAPHILLALSPHGYGHGAMTAPIIAEIVRRCPALRLTIQTGLPGRWLRSRYGMPFTHVQEIPDFGLVMRDANTVDVARSLERYDQLFDRLDLFVTAEIERFQELKPDLIIANIPFVTIIAARRLGIPVVALSSLNWADILEAYGGQAAEGHVASMRAAYASANLFLKLEPCLPTLWLPNAIAIEAVALAGTGRREEICRKLDLSPAAIKLGLLAFGGMESGIDPARIASVPGWHWILGQGVSPTRQDMNDLADLKTDFVDLVASVDAIVTKPGYGMFTEAAANGCRFLYLDRPDWPETPYLAGWASRHVPCAAIAREELFDARLAVQLARLLAEPVTRLARTGGASEAADHIMQVLGAARRVDVGGAPPTL